MVKKMFLNNTLIYLNSYQEEKTNGLYKVSVEFNVTSEEYHDIATLLYSEKFDVKIPEKDITFIGTIINYSTSLTNLYVKGQVGQYKLTLLEVKQAAKG